MGDSPDKENSLFDSPYGKAGVKKPLPEKEPVKAEGGEKEPVPAKKAEMPAPAPAVRDQRFDIMRSLGLLLIVVAHIFTTQSFQVFYQIRNFDVPMMVLISGAVYNYTTKRSNYGIYCYKRFIRLIAPTWVFLTFFYILGHFIFSPYPNFPQTLFDSYTLTNTIYSSYVWIIAVFALVALVVPLFDYLYRQIKNEYIYLAIVVLIYLFYEFFRHRYMSFRNPVVDHLFQNYFYFLPPYGCIAAFGYILPKLKKPVVWGSVGIFGALYAFLAVQMANAASPHAYVSLDTCKFPPSIYYVSYGMFGSLLVFLIVDLICRHKAFHSRALRFFSSSTIWIYLWHILYLKIWGDLIFRQIQNVLPLEVNVVFLYSLPYFILEYVFVLGCGILTTYLQKRFFSFLIRKFRMQSMGKAVLTELFLK